MSVDYVSDAASLRVSPSYPLRRRIWGIEPETTDLVLVFGGYAALRAPGSAIVSVERRDAGELVNRIRRMRTLPMHRILVKGYNPSLDYSTFPFSSVLDEVRRHAHPFGRLIVYGFSAGGYICLELVRRIWSDISMTGHVSGTQLGSTILRFPPPLADDAPGDLLPFLRVDYLVTIDPALDVIRTMSFDRRVAPCVRRNLDYYQTNRNFVGSRGLPTRAMDSQSTYIRSRDLTAAIEARGLEPHTHIDNHTYGTVVQKIQQALLDRHYEVVGAPDSNSTASAERARENETAGVAPQQKAGGALDSRIHFVVRGDTLSRISRKYYGDARLWRRIWEANNEVIGNNPNLIRVGQRLIIP